MLPFDVQTDPTRCTGCGACVQACPHDCIMLQQDEEGFDYPVVDDTCCVECGICESVCPANRDWRSLHETVTEPQLYAAWHLDSAIRQRSSSGGVFSALAQQVLNDGGVVFGAGFSPDLHLRHVAIQDWVHLDQLRGSKYLQSSTEKTYVEARQALDVGKLTLYSGTPCQISGLYSFLGGNPQGLYTVDLICHGVPSPLVFERYLHYLELRSDNRVASIDFRDKRRGWRLFSMVVTMQDGSAFSKTLYKDPYLICFLRNLCLRPACMACPYAATQRIGDITLGDFWGIHRSHPELDDDRGVSEVLINTSRGQRLFDASDSLLFTQECRLEDGMQQMLMGPSEASPKRAEFFADLALLSFEEIRRKYLKPRRVSLLRRIAGRAKRTLKQVLYST